MNNIKSIFIIVSITLSISLFGQSVPIIDYNINNNGQVLLEVESSSNEYFTLQVRHDKDSDEWHTTSVTLGKEGTTVISEPLSAYPIENYQVIKHNIQNPSDIDLDMVDDITELEDMPTLAPLNHSLPIDIINGTTSVNSLTTFKELSVDGVVVPWSPFLNDKQFVKFAIINLETDKPELYFINSVTHELHRKFMEAVNPDWIEDNTLIKGEITYNPTVVANNGTIGDFSFNYSVGAGMPFATVQKCHELISRNMPFLKNNLSYFIPEVSQEDYEADKELFDESRVPVLFEADVYADIDYLALNVAEGFGFLRVMELDETPNSRDVVLYESVPNTLPRVGGIITSFVQTPLSHVNLRAIQDNIPNAFIRDPFEDEEISNLINKYIYYKVEQDQYTIREATIDEVNQWFDDIRPTEEQTPKLNLTYEDILPLDDIEFEMSDGFGAKATNIATMRTFGFPEPVIPNGYAVPFYYYQEFMKYNGFFQDIEDMLSNPVFQSDLEARIDMLDDFRDKIKDADMPQWMLDELQTMQESFPEGTSIRCRSSTNNEDLPGFSGAGLYTSKTQHPHEGHISKSIKQVYASMWNFRAYDERDFYRVNQYAASMGVLCHPKYWDEKANGVGVSTDPIYQTDNTFYLNTQVGEDLVTNPEALSVPEEILLDIESVTEDDYTVLRYSSLTEGNTLIMTENYLDEMRGYLTIIHEEFKKLYKAENSPEFAIDIEYKITLDDDLIIKQARPWATFWSNLGLSVGGDLSQSLNFYPNPTQDYLNVECECDVENLIIYDIQGRPVSHHEVDLLNTSDQISTRKLESGIYFIAGYSSEGKIYFNHKIIKN